MRRAFSSFRLLNPYWSAVPRVSRIRSCVLNRSSSIPVCDLTCRLITGESVSISGSSVVVVERGSTLDLPLYKLKFTRLNEALAVDCSTTGCSGVVIRSVVLLGTSGTRLEARFKEKRLRAKESEGWRRDDCRVTPVACGPSVEIELDVDSVEDPNRTRPREPRIRVDGRGLGSLLPKSLEAPRTSLLLLLLGFATADVPATPTLRLAVYSNLWLFAKLTLTERRVVDSSGAVVVVVALVVVTGRRVGRVRRTAPP